MKTKNYTLMLVFVVCFSSCDKEVDNSNNDWEDLDCDNLKTGIINTDTDIVKSEINKLITDLEPVITDSDNIGHKENLYLLIERLNTHCDSISAELICYACIKTSPPQSEILVTTDSAGTTIKRVVDISTPDDDILYCVRIHEYYEPEHGQHVPFTVFLQSHVFFRSQSDVYAVLRNESDQQTLLDTIATGGWEFPTFSYTDSILVGIILATGPSSSTTFTIDSLVSTHNSIIVYSSLFTPNAQWTDVISPCSFVAIKQTEKHIYFNEVESIYGNDS